MIHLESQDKKNVDFILRKNVELLETVKRRKYNEQICHRNYTLAEGAECAKNGCRGGGKMLCCFQNPEVSLQWPRLEWYSDKKICLPMQEAQETQIQSLGQEDSLEKGISTHSSIVAWEIPWTEEPGGLQFMGSQRVRHDRAYTWHGDLSRGSGDECNEIGQCLR